MRRSRRWSPGVRRRRTRAAHREPRRRPLDRSGGAGSRRQRTTATRHGGAPDPTAPSDSQQPHSDDRAAAALATPPAAGARARRRCPCNVRPTILPWARCSLPAAAARRRGAWQHRRGIAGDPPRRAGGRDRREGAEGGEGRRGTGRSGRPAKPPASALAVTTTGFGPEPCRPRSRCRRPSRCRVSPSASCREAAAASHRRGAGTGKCSGAPPARGAARRALPPRDRLVGDAELRAADRVTSCSSRRCAARRPAEEDGASPRSPAWVKSAKAQTGASTGSVEGQGGAGRRARADRRPRRAGQGGQGRHDGRPAAGHVRQEGVHRRREGRDRGEVAEDAQGGRQLQGVGQGRRGQGRGQGPGHAGKDGQAKDIETATEAPPDQSKAVPKPVTPMAPEQPGQTAAVPAAGAVPKPAPPEQLNLAAGKHEANQEMAEGEVSEQQLAQSNEPQFQEALDDKQAAAAHARHRARAVPAAGAAGHRPAQGRRVRAGDGRASPACRARKAAALAKLVADEGQDQDQGRGQARRGHREDPGHLRGDRDGCQEASSTASTRRWRRRSTRARPARGRRSRPTSRPRCGVQEGPLRRLAGRAALGQGQAARDARQGQRVLRGRPRALPQADGRGDHPRRRHRRRRPDRRQDADRAGRTEIAAYVKSLPADLQKVGSRGVEGDRRPVRAAGERRRRQAGGGGRHPGHEVRRGAQGPRRADRGAAGREQGPGRQGHRRDQGRHQHDPRARGDAAERARPGRRRRRRHRQERRSSSSAT